MKRSFPMLRALLPIAAAALAAALLAVPATGATPSKPFRGTVKEASTFSIDPACGGGFRTTWSGSGHMLHMGRVTATGSDCVSFDSSGVAHVTDGRMVMIAANGDTVEVSYAVAGPPSPDGVYHLDGTFTVTGGTGRFEGASGGGAGHSEASPTGDTLIELNGRTIS